MTSARRKKAIRAVMAETGMKYTAAMRELDRRNTEEDVRRALRQDANRTAEPGRGAQYWVLVSDEVMRSSPQWPGGLRPVQSDDRPAGRKDVRWWLFEDDDAPPELNRKDVELVFRREDGRLVLAERRLVT